MDKHTPQPWTAERPTDLRKPVVVSGPYGVIARFERGNSANVDLFLAAPDLLAALQQIANHLTNADYDAKGGLNENGRKVIREVARAAIARAGAS